MTRTATSRASIRTTSTKGSRSRRSERVCPFTTRIRITAPAAYTLNSVGIEDRGYGRGRDGGPSSGRATAGAILQRGRGTLERNGAGREPPLYYHPPAHVQHRRDEPRPSTRRGSTTRNGSMPFPWEELKLSEFPGIAFYAQGFPTEHHLLRGDRLPHEERSEDERRLPRDRARIGAPVVGEHPDAGKGSRRRTSCPRGWPTSRRSS